MSKILSGFIILLLCVGLFFGNKYFKGLVALKIYENNQMLVDNVINKGALKYFLPGFELPENELCKETIQVHYRNMYAWYGTLYLLNKQGILLPGAWDSIEGSLRRNIAQNKPMKEYAEMIADGRRVWNKNFQLYIEEIVKNPRGW